MNDHSTQRILGALMEFRDQTRAEFAEIKADQAEIRADIRNLSRFKWKVAGSATAICLLIQAGFAVFQALKQ